jgi:HSP20 family protein
VASTLMLTPVLYMYPDDKYENFLIEVVLPGVEKKDISFKLDDNNFYLVANKENVKYVASYPTCCPVDGKKAVAKYENGVLKVTVPYKEPIAGLVSVKIE